MKTTTTRSKTIECTIDIDASPEAVWAVLMDVARYDEWNPFLTFDADEPPRAVGERIAITVGAGKRRMRFKPTVTAYEEGRQLAWLGRFLVPGLFDGAHTLAVEPLPGGRTRFVHRETFRGVLVGLARRTLRDTEAGFVAMNEALRDRVAAQTRVAS